MERQDRRGKMSRYLLQGGLPSMPRIPRAPGYRLHRASGQAVVTFNQGKQRHTVYLGVYDSPESHAMYKRKVAEWFAAGGTEPPPRKAAITVSELLAAYWVHAKAYYVKDGEPTTQQRRIKKTIGMVGDLYGSTPASEFSPRALKAVREVMVREGWKRKVVNQRVQLIVQAFRWAVEEELVGATVHQALTAVDALKKGRTPAPESEKVDPPPCPPRCDGRPVADGCAARGSPGHAAVRPGRQGRGVVLPPGVVEDRTPRGQREGRLHRTAVSGDPAEAVAGEGG